MPKPSTLKSFFNSKVHKKSSSNYRVDPNKKYIDVENTHKINKSFPKQNKNNSGNSFIFNTSSINNQNSF